VDAGRLDDGADGAAGDDARSRARGLEQHLARAHVPEGLVGDRHAVERDGEEVLAGLIVALADGLGDLVGLAEADADMAGLVAHDDQRGEAEATTALHDLRDAVDVDDALLEFFIVHLIERHIDKPSCVEQAALVCADEP
jgi:hypothetical protein